MEEGRAALAEALASLENSGERAYEADILQLQADFLLTDGTDGEAEAEELLRSAIVTARRQQAKSLELRATSSLARLLVKQNRRHEARQTLAEIYNWFTEGFATTALKEASSLLQQLR